MEMQEVLVTSLLNPSQPPVGQGLSLKLTKADSKQGVAAAYLNVSNVQALISTSLQIPAHRGHTATGYGQRCSSPVAQQRQQQQRRALSAAQAGVRNTGSEQQQQQQQPGQQQPEEASASSSPQLSRRPRWDSSVKLPSEVTFTDALAAWQQALERGMYAPKLLGSIAAVSSGSRASAAPRTSSSSKAAAARSTKSRLGVRPAGQHSLARPATVSAISSTTAPVGSSAGAGGDCGVSSGGAGVMPVVFLGSGEDALQALEGLVLRHLVLRHNLTLMQLQRSVQSISCLDSSCQLAAIGVLVRAGFWLAAMQVAYAGGLGVLSGVLHEMRAIIELGLDWDDQLLAAAAWSWASVDRGLFLHTFRGSELTTHYLRLRKQLTRLQQLQVAAREQQQRLQQRSPLAAYNGPGGSSGSMSAAKVGPHPDLARAERVLLISIVDSYLQHIAALAAPAAPTAFDLQGLQDAGPTNVSTASTQTALQRPRDGSSSPAAGLVGCYHGLEAAAAGSAKSQPSAQPAGVHGRAGQSHKSSPAPGSSKQRSSSSGASKGRGSISSGKQCSSSSNGLEPCSSTLHVSSDWRVQVSEGPQAGGSGSGNGCARDSSSSQGDDARDRSSSSNSEGRTVQSGVEEPGPSATATQLAGDASTLCGINSAGDALTPSSSSTAASSDSSSGSSPATGSHAATPDTGPAAETVLCQPQQQQAPTSQQQVQPQEEEEEAQQAACSVAGVAAPPEQQEQAMQQGHAQLKPHHHQQQHGAQPDAPPPAPSQPCSRPQSHQASRKHSTAQHSTTQGGSRPGTAQHLCMSRALSGFSAGAEAGAVASGSQPQQQQQQWPPAVGSILALPGTGSIGSQDTRRLAHASSCGSGSMNSSHGISISGTDLGGPLLLHTAAGGAGGAGGRLRPCSASPGASKLSWPGTAAAETRMRPGSAAPGTCNGRLWQLGQQGQQEWGPGAGGGVDDAVGLQRFKEACSMHRQDLQHWAEDSAASDTSSAQHQGPRSSATAAVAAAAGQSRPASAAGPAAATAGAPTAPVDPAVALGAAAAAATQASHSRASGPNKQDCDNSSSGTAVGEQAGGHGSSMSAATKQQHRGSGLVPHLPLLEAGIIHPDDAQKAEEEAQAHDTAAAAAAAGNKGRSKAPHKVAASSTAADHNPRPAVQRGAAAPGYKAAAEGGGGQKAEGCPAAARRPAGQTQPHAAGSTTAPAVAPVETSQGLAAAATGAATAVAAAQPEPEAGPDQAVQQPGEAAAGGCDTQGVTWRGSSEAAGSSRSGTRADAVAAPAQHAGAQALAAIAAALAQASPPPAAAAAAAARPSDIPAGSALTASAAEQQPTAAPPPAAAAGPAVQTGQEQHLAAQHSMPAAAAASSSSQLLVESYQTMQQFAQQLQQTARMAQQLQQTARMAQQLLAQQVAGQAAREAGHVPPGSSSSRPGSAAAAAAAARPGSAATRRPGSGHRPGGTGGGLNSGSSRPGSAAAAARQFGGLHNSSGSGSAKGLWAAAGVHAVGGPYAECLLGGALLGVQEEPPSAEEVDAYARYLGMDPAQDAELLHIAEEALLAPVPPGWTVHLDAAENEFFFNIATGVSSYEHPLDEHYRQRYQQLRAGE